MLDEIESFDLYFAASIRVDVTDPCHRDACKALAAAVVRRAHLDLQNLKRGGLGWSKAKAWLTDWASHDVYSIRWCCHVIGIAYGVEKVFVLRLLAGEKILKNNTGDKGRKNQLQNIQKRNRKRKLSHAI